MTQTVDSGQQHARAGEDQLAQRGGPRAAVVALEQRSAERSLDAVELGRQRRLGEPEPGRGLRDAAVLRDRTHHAQMPQFEVHALSVGGVVPNRRG